MFGLSSAYYIVVLFVILSRRFICVVAIQTGKADLISPRFQIMVISILKNWSRRYFSYYIIKFIGFMLIYDDINLDIVLFCMVFRYLYLGSIDLLQVLINYIIFFLSKINITKNWIYMVEATP